MIEISKKLDTPEDSRNDLLIKANSTLANFVIYRMFTRSFLCQHILRLRATEYLHMAWSSRLLLRLASWPIPQTRLRQLLAAAKMLLAFYLAWNNNLCQYLGHFHKPFPCYAARWQQHWWLVVEFTVHICLSNIHHRLASNNGRQHTKHEKYQIVVHAQSISKTSAAAA